MIENTNYVPTFYVMTGIIEALLRLREHEKNNKTFAPYVPILSYQIERVGFKWRPCRELAILTNKGFVCVSPETGAIKPTDKFDSLASQVLETEETEESYPPVEPTVYLGGRMSNAIGEEDINISEVYAWSSFERVGDTFELRRNYVEEFDMDREW